MHGIKKNGTMVVHAVSIILAVGVALSYVDDVHYTKVYTHTKVVTTICQGADDQKLCHDSLDPVNTSDPKDFIKAVVESTMNTVIQAFNFTNSISVNQGNSSARGLKMAVDDCKDLLESALGELQASINLVHDNNAKSMIDQEAILKNYLGAVIAYQQSCLDGFSLDDDSEKVVKSQLQTGGLDNVAKLSGLALDVVSKISQLLSIFDLDLNLKPSSHHPLNEVDQDGYPSWLSDADRKILADMNSGNQVKPNVVVGKDGSGQFKTILEAINSYPANFKGRFVIYIKAGVYDEYIFVGKKMPNILIYGDGPTRTIITGNKSFTSNWKTIGTATFTTVAEGFIAKSIAFKNTAGAAGHQAVALRVMGDRSVFFQCAMHSYQDTLYAHAKRQFYRNCEIFGTVDIIFGYASTLIQNSRIVVRKPEANQKNTVVADGTFQKNMPTGVVLQNCQIVADTDLFPYRLTVKSYLARPWKAYSKAIIMESDIGDLIDPDGYLPWKGDMYLETCYFAEYGNTGVGAAVDKRVKWAHGLLTKDDAAHYTAEQWLQASTWLLATGIPFNGGFTKV